MPRLHIKLEGQIHSEARANGDSNQGRVGLEQGCIGESGPRSYM